MTDPPVEVSDWEVAHELARLLGERPFFPHLDLLLRIALAYSEGGAVAVVALVRRELAEAKRRDLAVAEATFERGAGL